MQRTWADHILEYHFHLKPGIRLPEGITWLYPYDRAETRAAMEAFYRKYYHDTHQRCLVLGINPGRFGAGVTGVAFTDPVRLEEKCGIPNTFKKRRELSSAFVYECIETYGGVRPFFQQFYISSVCPLGFLKEQKNYNYYDSKVLQNAVLPLIRDYIAGLIAAGASRARCLCLGKGKNFKFLNALNEEEGYFDEVLPLPHPRWVMQYRSKRKAEFNQVWQDALDRC